MISLPTPQQLRYLLALSEHRHFGRAAEACAVTQSTLSAGILALERQLDARVIDRDGSKRVVFTPLGLDLLGRARTALAALADLAETARAFRAPLSGPLRLGVIPTIGPFLLPRLMPALRAAFPHLQLYVTEDVTDRVVERLRAGRLDLVLLALPCASAGTETLPIGRDAFLAALPPGHPLADLDEVPATALAGEQLLLLEEGHCLRGQALEACGFARGAAPAAPVDGFAATSLHTLVQMVAGGLGITLLPRIAVDAGVARGTGVALRPLAGAGAWRTLGLAWRPNAPRAADFRMLAPVLTQSVLRPEGA